jgi:hypothetical protein
MTVMSACNISFVDLLMFPFDVFGGVCGGNSCDVLTLLFIMVLWAPIFATLCIRAVLMLWHAFVFLGLRYVGIFLLDPLRLVAFTPFSCKCQL